MESVSYFVVSIGMHWVASKVFVELHSLRDGYIESERLGLESAHTMQSIHVYMKLALDSELIPYPMHPARWS